MHIIKFTPCFGKFTCKWKANTKQAVCMIRTACKKLWQQKNSMKSVRSEKANMKKKCSVPVHSYKWSRQHKRWWPFHVLYGINSIWIRSTHIWTFPWWYANTRSLLFGFSYFSISHLDINWYRFTVSIRLLYKFNGSVFFEFTAKCERLMFNECTILTPCIVWH